MSGLLQGIIGVIGIAAAIVTENPMLGIASGALLLSDASQQGWLGNGPKNFFNSSAGQDLTLAVGLASAAMSVTSLMSATQTATASTAVDSANAAAEGTGDTAAAGATAADQAAAATGGADAPVAVFFYGRYEGTQAAWLKARPATVNSQIILDRITSQYFLVTKTIFADSKVEIETPKNNNWTDYFVGKKITVGGVIRIDVGVDMKNLSLENILVDSEKKTVTIKLPHAEILDSSLYGQLDFSENKAIVDKLKGFFKDTQNEDYNLALQALVDSAKKQVSADEEIFTQARADSVKLVDLIVSGTAKDYQVVIE